MNRARASHSLTLAVTLALACTPPPAVTPAEPAPMLADVAPVTAEPSDEPIPMSDGPALLSKICTPVWVTHSDGARRIACTTHGPYSTASRFTGTAIGEHQGDPRDVCELASVQRGSFTRSGAGEVLLAFAECFERNRSPTASVVVVGDDKPLLFLNDLRLDGCEKTRKPDGRDIFYCEETKHVDHTGTGTGYVVVDFAHPGRHTGVVLTLMRHDFDCAWFQSGAKGKMARGYVWMRPPKFHVAAGNLVVEVERTFAPASPTLDARLAQECQASPDTDGLAALPPAEKTQLVFEPRNDGYVATAATQPIVTAWTRDFNDYRLRTTTPVVWSPSPKK